MYVGWILILTLLFCALMSTRGGTMVDEMFGEALLTSIRPELKTKLVKIHEKGAAKNYSTKQMLKLVKLRLSSDEIEELEKAYKRLLLPVLESTLDPKHRRRVDINDVPMKMLDAESEEEILSEENEYSAIDNAAPSTQKPKKFHKIETTKKNKKKQKRDSVRPMGKRPSENIENNLEVNNSESSDPVKNKDEL